MSRRSLAARIAAWPCWLGMAPAATEIYGTHPRSTGHTLGRPGAAPCARRGGRPGELLGDRQQRVRDVRDDLVGEFLHPAPPGPRRTAQHFASLARLQPAPFGEDRH